MSDDYYTDVAITFVVHLALLFALLYRSHLRKLRWQKQSAKITPPMGARREFSTLIQEIQEWQAQHRHLPLNDPEIQVRVNRAFGLAEYLWNHTECIDGHVAYWCTILHPFVGIKVQKESG